MRKSLSILIVIIILTGYIVLAKGEVKKWSYDRVDDNENNLSKNKNYKP